MPHKCLFDKVANAQPPVSEDIAKTRYIVEAITGQIVWEPQSDGDRIMSSKVPLYQMKQRRCENTTQDGSGVTQAPNVVQPGTKSYNKLIIDYNPTASKYFSQGAAEAADGFLECKLEKVVTANVQICEAVSASANNNVTENTENTEITESTGDDTCTDIYKHNRRLDGLTGGVRKNTVCCGFKAEVAYMKSQQGASYDPTETLFPQARNA